MTASAVALLSGGLDSGTGLELWLARPGHSVSLALTFDYGQRSAAAEARVAAELAGRNGVPWRGIELPWLRGAAQRSGSALVTDAELPSGSAERPGDAASAAAVWVPARNVVFLAIAAAFAEAQGDTVVLCGFNREEAETFPDNSPEFVAAMDEVLRLGTRSAVTVCSPTLDLDKIEIVAAARACGLGPGDFWSCYLGGPVPCGTCESCVRSTRAWATKTR